MGCNSTKQAAPAAGAPASAGAASGKVEVYGLTGSMNCMGPVLLVSSKKIGSMVPTMPGPDGTLKADFIAMNPFHQIPTIKDGGVVLAESSAILRYLARKYAPELYPEADVARRAYIDWAMDNFYGTLYKDVYACVYPILGYAPAPADREAAGKTATENMAEYAKFFLREKFVGGDKLSIADYKIAPHLFCYTHPVLKEQSFVECPDRIKQYVKDFMAACPSSEMLKTAGGFGLKEMFDAKRGSPGDLMLEPSSEVKFEADVLKGKAVKTGGKVQIYGVPPSCNCLGAILVGQDAGAAELVPTMPGEATRTPEFLAMNPFHAVPTMKDGDLCLAESAAIMRYLAEQYKPELYPKDPAVRGRIDWAIDNFAFGVYPDVPKTLYPCLGFCEFPADTKEVGKSLAEKMKTYADFFLKSGKFVCGDTLTIADYKVAPFFYALEHPALKAKCDLEVPARISQYTKDFMAASSSSAIFTSAGGFALKEMLDAKM